MPTDVFKIPPVVREQSMAQVSNFVDEEHKLALAVSKKERNEPMNPYEAALSLQDKERSFFSLLPVQPDTEDASKSPRPQSVHPEKSNVSQSQPVIRPFWVTYFTNVSLADPTIGNLPSIAFHRRCSQFQPSFILPLSPSTCQIIDHPDANLLQIIDLKRNVSYFMEPYFAQNPSFDDQCTKVRAYCRKLADECKLPTDIHLGPAATYAQSIQHARISWYKALRAARVSFLLHNSTNGRNPSKVTDVATHDGVELDLSPENNASSVPTPSQNIIRQESSSLFAQEALFGRKTDKQVFDEITQNQDDPIYKLVLTKGVGLYMVRTGRVCESCQKGRSYTDMTILDPPPAPPTAVPIQPRIKFGRIPPGGDLIDAVRSRLVPEPALAMDEIPEEKSEENSEEKNGDKSIISRIRKEASQRAAEITRNIRRLREESVRQLRAKIFGKSGEKESKKDEESKDEESKDEEVMVLSNLSRLKNTKFGSFETFQPPPPGRILKGFSLSRRPPVLAVVSPVRLLRALYMLINETPPFSLERGNAFQVVGEFVSALPFLFGSLHIASVQSNEHYRAAHQLYAPLYTESPQDGCRRPIARFEQEPAPVPPNSLELKKYLGEELARKVLSEEACPELGDRFFKPDIAGTQTFFRFISAELEHYRAMATTPGAEVTWIPTGDSAALYDPLLEAEIRRWRNATLAEQTASTQHLMAVLGISPAHERRFLINQSALQELRWWVTAMKDAYVSVLESEGEEATIARVRNLHASMTLAISKLQGLVRSQRSANKSNWSFAVEDTSRAPARLKTALSSITPILEKLYDQRLFRRLVHPVYGTWIRALWAEELVLLDHPANLPELRILANAFLRITRVRPIYELAVVRSNFRIPTRPAKRGEPDDDAKLEDYWAYEEDIDSKMEDEAEPAVCRHCITQHMHQLMQSGLAHALDQIYGVRDLHDLLTREEVKQYEEQASRHIFSSSQMLTKCPKDGCGQTFAVDLGRLTLSALTAVKSPLLKREMTNMHVLHYLAYAVRCPWCQTEFCRACRQGWDTVVPATGKPLGYHRGFDCDEYQRFVKISERCRFCNAVCAINAVESIPNSSSRQSAAQGVCDDLECIARSTESCPRRLPCGHYCAGFANEPFCPPCLHPDCVDKRLEEETEHETKALSSIAEEESKLVQSYSSDYLDIYPAVGEGGGLLRSDSEVNMLQLSAGTRDKQTSHLTVSGVRHRTLATTLEDTCSLCQTEELGRMPIIVLDCGHVFHFSCVKKKLNAKRGHSLSFKFLRCPLCNMRMSHPSLMDIIAPYQRLESATQSLALFIALNDSALMKEFHHRDGALALRMEEFEEKSDPPGLNRDPSTMVLVRGAEAAATDTSSRRDLISYALDYYVFYQCSRCDKPYFGGARACGPAEEAANLEPDALICPQCQNVPRCNKHDNMDMMYKCRFCCSIATFFCFSKVHYCTRCHSRPYEHIDNNKETKTAFEDLPQCGDLRDKIREVKNRNLPKEEEKEALAKLRCDPGTCPLKIAHPPNGVEFLLGCSLCREEILRKNATDKPRDAPISDDRLDVGSILLKRMARTWLIKTQADMTIIDHTKAVGENAGELANQLGSVLDGSYARHFSHLTPRAASLALRLSAAALMAAKDAEDRENKMRQLAKQAESKDASQTSAGFGVSWFWFSAQQPLWYINPSHMIKLRVRLLDSDDVDALFLAVYQQQRFRLGSMPLLTQVRINQDLTEADCATMDCQSSVPEGCLSGSLLAADDPSDVMKGDVDTSRGFYCFAPQHEPPENASKFRARYLVSNGMSYPVEQIFPDLIQAAKAKSGPDSNVKVTDIVSPWVRATHSSHLAIGLIPRAPELLAPCHFRVHNSSKTPSNKGESIPSMSLIAQKGLIFFSSGDVYCDGSHLGHFPQLVFTEDDLLYVVVNCTEGSVMLLRQGHPLAAFTYLAVQSQPMFLVVGLSALARPLEVVTYPDTTTIDEMSLNFRAGAPATGVAESIGALAGSHGSNEALIQVTGTGSKVKRLGEGRVQLGGQASVLRVPTQHRATMNYFQSVAQARKVVVDHLARLQCIRSGLSGAFTKLFAQFEQQMKLASDANEQTKRASELQSTMAALLTRAQEEEQKAVDALASARRSWLPSDQEAHPLLPRNIWALLTDMFQDQRVAAVAATASPSQKNNQSPQWDQYAILAGSVLLQNTRQEGDVVSFKQAVRAKVQAGLRFGFHPDTATTRRLTCTAFDGVRWDQDSVPVSVALQYEAHGYAQELALVSNRIRSYPLVVEKKFEAVYGFQPELHRVDDVKLPQKFGRKDRGRAAEAKESKEAKEAKEAKESKEAGEPNDADSRKISLEFKHSIPLDIRSKLDSLTMPPMLFNHCSDEVGLLFELLCRLLPVRGPAFRHIHEALSQELSKGKHVLVGHLKALGKQLPVRFREQYLSALEKLNVTIPEIAEYVSKQAPNTEEVSVLSTQGLKQAHWRNVARAVTNALLTFDHQACGVGKIFRADVALRRVPGLVHALSLDGSTPTLFNSLWPHVGIRHNPYCIRDALSCSGGVLETISDLDNNLFFKQLVEESDIPVPRVQILNPEHFESSYNRHLVARTLTPHASLDVLLTPITDVAHMYENSYLKCMPDVETRLSVQNATKNLYLGGMVYCRDVMERRRVVGDPLDPHAAWDETDARTMLLVTEPPLIVEPGITNLREIYHLGQAQEVLLPQGGHFGKYEHAYVLAANKCHPILAAITVVTAFESIIRAGAVLHAADGFFHPVNAIGYDVPLTPIFVASEADLGAVSKRDAASLAERQSSLDRIEFERYVEMGMKLVSKSLPSLPDHISMHHTLHPEYIVDGGSSLSSYCKGYARSPYPLVPIPGTFASHPLSVPTEGCKTRADKLPVDEAKASFANGVVPPLIRQGIGYMEFVLTYKPLLVNDSKVSSDRKPVGIRPSCIQIGLVSSMAPLNAPLGEVAEVSFSLDGILRGTAVRRTAPAMARIYDAQDEVEKEMKTDRRRAERNAESAEIYRQEQEKEAKFNNATTRPFQFDSQTRLDELVVGIGINYATSCIFVTVNGVCVQLARTHNFILSSNLRPAIAYHRTPSSRALARELAKSKLTSEPDGTAYNHSRYLAGLSPLEIVDMEDDDVGIVQITPRYLAPFVWKIPENHIFDVEAATRFFRAYMPERIDYTSDQNVYKSPYAFGSLLTPFEYGLLSRADLDFVLQVAATESKLAKGCTLEELKHTLALPQQGAEGLNGPDSMFAKGLMERPCLPRSVALEILKFAYPPDLRSRVHGLIYSSDGGASQGLQFRYIEFTTKRTVECAKQAFQELIGELEQFLASTNERMALLKEAVTSIPTAPRGEFALRLCADEDTTARVDARTERSFILLNDVTHLVEKYAHILHKKHSTRSRLDILRDLECTIFPRVLASSSALNVLAELQQLHSYVLNVLMPTDPHSYLQHYVGQTALSLIRHELGMMASFAHHRLTYAPKTYKTALIQRQNALTVASAFAQLAWVGWDKPCADVHVPEFRSILALLAANVSPDDVLRIRDDCEVVKTAAAAWLDDSAPLSASAHHLLTPYQTMEMFVFNAGMERLNRLYIGGIQLAPQTLTPSAMLLNAPIFSSQPAKGSCITKASGESVDYLRELEPATYCFDYLVPARTSLPCDFRHAEHYIKQTRFAQIRSDYEPLPYPFHTVQSITMQSDETFFKLVPKWVCGSCTYAGNPSSESKCAICAGARPDKQKYLQSELVHELPFVAYQLNHDLVRASQTAQALRSSLKGENALRCIELRQEARMGVSIAPTQSEPLRFDPTVKPERASFRLDSPAVRDNNRLASMLAAVQELVPAAQVAHTSLTPFVLPEINYETSLSDPTSFGSSQELSRDVVEHKQPSSYGLVVAAASVSLPQAFGLDSTARPTLPGLFLTVKAPGTKQAETTIVPGESLRQFITLRLPPWWSGVGVPEKPLPLNFGPSQLNQQPVGLGTKHVSIVLEFKILPTSYEVQESNGQPFIYNRKTKFGLISISRRKLVDPRRRHADLDSTCLLHVGQYGELLLGSHPNPSPEPDPHYSTDFYALRNRRVHVNAWHRLVLLFSGTANRFEPDLSVKAFLDGNRVNVHHGFSNDDMKELLRSFMATNENVRENVDWNKHHQPGGTAVTLLPGSVKEGTHFMLKRFSVFNRLLKQQELEDLLRPMRMDALVAYCGGVLPDRLVLDRAHIIPPLGDKLYVPVREDKTPGQDGGVLVLSLSGDGRETALSDLSNAFTVPFEVLPAPKDVASARDTKDIRYEDRRTPSMIVHQGVVYLEGGINPDPSIPSNVIAAFSPQEARIPAPGTTLAKIEEAQKNRIGLTDSQSRPRLGHRSGLWRLLPHVEPSPPSDSEPATTARSRHVERLQRWRARASDGFRSCHYKAQQKGSELIPPARFEHWSFKIGNSVVSASGQFDGVWVLDLPTHTYREPNGFLAPDGIPVAGLGIIPAALPKWRKISTVQGPAPQSDLLRDDALLASTNQSIYVVPSRPTSSTATPPIVYELTIDIDGNTGYVGDSATWRCHRTYNQFGLNDYDSVSRPDNHLSFARLTTTQDSTYQHENPESKLHEVVIPQPETYVAIAAPKVPHTPVGAVRGARAIIHDGFMYVVGGFYKDATHAYAYLPFIRCLDLMSMAWRSIDVYYTNGKLVPPRMGHSLTIYNGRLYVIGGTLNQMLVIPLPEPVARSSVGGQWFPAERPTVPSDLPSQAINELSQAISAVPPPKPILDLQLDEDLTTTKPTLYRITSADRSEPGSARVQPDHESQRERDNRPREKKEKSVGCVQQ